VKLHKRGIAIVFPDTFQFHFSCVVIEDTCVDWRYFRNDT
jgi:hypothetical protein